MELFKGLQDSNILDIQNKLQIECLRYSFEPLIKHDIYCAAEEWNDHKVRKQKGRGMLGGLLSILYRLPEDYGAYDCKQEVNQEHTDIFMESYAGNPKLCHEEYDNLLVEYPPITASDALDYFNELWTSISSVVMS